MNRPSVFLMTLAVFAALAPVSALSDPWDSQINRPNRFVVLADFGGAAVLDRFVNVRVTGDPANPLSSSAYWTATTWATDPAFAAWEVEFQTGVVANTNKTGFLYVWCVRGGSGTDSQ